MTQIATVEKLLPGGYAEISVPRKSACGHDCEECAGCGMTGAAIHARAKNDAGAKLTAGLPTEGWRYAAAIAAAALFFLPSVFYDRRAKREESLTYTILRLF